MSTVHATGESVWINSVEIPRRPPLARDTTADVCVVGAGIAGLSVAYHLSKAGLKVVVLDDGTIGSGQTQCTSAHLSSVLDDRYFEIEGVRGQDGARLAAASHAAAVDRIEHIIAAEQIECDFARVDGYLFGPPAGHEDELERELAAAQRTGVLDVTRLTRVPLSSFDSGPCLRFGRQAQFHPLKYLIQLAHAAEAYGARIYCQTHAQEIAGGAHAHVRTSDGPTVNCAHVVVATNTPVNDMFAIHTKQSPYMTYVIGAQIAHGAVPQALYWDMLDPYHYVRLQPHGAGDGSDLLIVGGEDHKTGQADHTKDRHQQLIEWARAHFPIGEVEYRWAGQVMETLDGLAFIGRNPINEDNVYIATGDSGMGLTHGTIAGMLLCDLILGKQNPWTELYDPSRMPIKAAGQYIKENLNVAAQYASLITGGEVSSPNEVLPGQGAIMRQGLTKIAIHRDAEGHLHQCSAICPHLGCVVEFNDAEQTWDCPCHGSRFRASGEVVQGPANKNLEPVKD